MENVSGWMLAALGIFVGAAVAAYYYYMATQDLKEQTKELKKETSKLKELQATTMRMIEFMSKGDEVEVIRNEEGEPMDSLAITATLADTPISAIEDKPFSELEGKTLLSRIRRIEEAMKRKKKD